MPAYLKEAGYYTGFIGKTHINPERVVEDFIDYRGIRAANFNSTFSIDEYAAQARTIFENAQAAEKPFLAIINYSDAHRAFIGKSKAGYPTVQVEGDIPPLPWIGCDTPRLREEMRNYLNCMNRLDEGIGLVLADLEEAQPARQYPGDLHRRSRRRFSTGQNHLLRGRREGADDRELSEFVPRRGMRKRRWFRPWTFCRPSCRKPALRFPANLSAHPCRIAAESTGLTPPQDTFTLSTPAPRQTCSTSPSVFGMSATS